MEQPIQIVLVEDNPEYRNVIKMALDRTPEMNLTNKFGTAEQALRVMDTDPVARQADILLLDLNLPKMSGIEAMTWFKNYIPRLKIIALTQSDKERDVIQAIQQGASGYLLKSSTVSQIKDCIHTIYTGGGWLDPKVAQYILNRIQNTQPTIPPEKALSQRELDVLQLLGDGLVKKEIAHKLKISTHTVATHVKHIYEKLDVLNAPSAIATAYQSGILPIKKKTTDDS